jgi:uncharacterized protein YfkK (UPF0435 family)
MTPDREPLAQALNSIVATTNVAGRMVIRPENYDEVLAEAGTLWTIKSNIEFILSYIREREDAKQREMQAAE